MSSINGKILTENWGNVLESGELGNLYEDFHEKLDAQAWMCGRNTLEIDFTHGAKPELVKSSEAITRTIYKANSDAESFAIAIDTHGKLGWQDDNIDGDHVISMLSEKVSDEYLHFLKRKGISYIVSGKSEVDLKAAFGILYTEFGIGKILLEGGGHVNGSIYEAGLLDELSLIVLPIIDTTPNTPTVFEYTSDSGKNEVELLELKEVKQLAKGALWLNYRTK